MRLSRFQVLPVLAAVPLLLAACGGGGNGSAAAGVTPTATASIEIIGTPAPAGGNTITSNSGTASSSAGLTIRATGSSVIANTAATSSTTGSTYTVTGTGGSNLVLRQAPNGTKIGDVPAGGVVTSLGDPTQQAGSYTWLHVKTAKGQQGWVATKYLSGGIASPTATPVPGGQQ